MYTDGTDPRVGRNEMQEQEEMGPYARMEEWPYKDAEWSPWLEERRPSAHADAQHGGDVVERACGGSIQMLPLSQWNKKQDPHPE